MSEKVEVIAELKDLISGKMKEINDSVNKLDSSLQSVNETGGKSGGIMGQVLGANLLTNAISRGASALVGFGKDSLDAFGNFEQFETSLTTMFHGNRKEAEMLSGQLQQFAKATPFELTEIQEATKMMIAYGSSSGSVKNELTTLGDISSGVGAPLKDIAYLYGTLRTQGRAYAMDIRQFAGRGIPIIEALAKQFKVSKEEVMKLVEKGKVGFPQVQAALEGMTKEGGQFFNMMSEQSKTLKGSISNLNDGIDQLKVNFGAAFAEVAKGAVSVMTDALNEINVQLNAFNKTSKLFNQKGIGYTGMERMTGQDVVNNMVQEKMTAAVGAADTEAKMHRLKAVFATELSRLSAKYTEEREKEKMGVGEGVSALDYSRRRALLKDAMAELDAGIGSKKKASTDKVEDSAKAAKAKDLEKLAQANKPTQININIENLVREMTNKMYQSAGESLENMAEAVSKVMTAMVNDISVLQQIQ